MFNHLNTTATRMDYERQMAAAADLSQYAPSRPSVAARVAKRIKLRRTRPNGSFDR